MYGGSSASRFTAATGPGKASRTSSTFALRRRPSSPTRRAPGGSRAAVSLPPRATRSLVGPASSWSWKFTDRGPRALALLVSGQTGDTTSPRFREQTEMFAARLWWTFPTVPQPAGGSAGSSSHASSGASPARLRSLHLESTPEMAEPVAADGCDQDLESISIDVDTRESEVHRALVTSS